MRSPEALIDVRYYLRKGAGLNKFHIWHSGRRKAIRSLIVRRDSLPKVGGEERMRQLMETVVRISESDYGAILQFDDDGAYSVDVVYDVFRDPGLTSSQDESDNAGSKDSLRDFSRTTKPKNRTRSASS